MSEPTTDVAPYSYLAWKARAEKAEQMADDYSRLAARETAARLKAEAALRKIIEADDKIQAATSRPERFDACHERNAAIDRARAALTQEQK